MPQRLQHRRTHPARPRQLLELGQMALFLLGHAADFVARATGAGDGELAVIDSHGAVFAGMIDADHRLDLRFGRRIAGQVRRTIGVIAASPDSIIQRPGVPVRSGATGRAYQNAPAQITAITNEANRFKPASDTPKSDHCGWSQRTTCALKIRCRISSSVVGAAAARGAGAGTGEPMLFDPEMVERKAGADEEHKPQHQRHPGQRTAVARQTARRSRS